MAQLEVQNGSSATEVAFTAVKPQLFVEAPKASDAVQFYKAAFGAVETGRTTQLKRKADQELPHIISAQLQLAGSAILVSDLSDDSAKMNTTGTGFTLCLETENVEAAIAKAVAAGAVAEEEVEDESTCCGRVGKVKDPYGFTWLICSPAKKSSPDVEA